MGNVIQCEIFDKEYVERNKDSIINSFKTEENIIYNTIHTVYEFGKIEIDTDGSHFIFTRS